MEESFVLRSGKYVTSGLSDIKEVEEGGSYLFNSDKMPDGHGIYGSGYKK